MSRWLLFLFGIMTLLLFPLTAAAALFGEGTVPNAARSIADQMDKQLMRRIGDAPGGRANLSIVSTVSVSLNNLNESNPLSRQISEEIMNALIAKGYLASDIRKGKDITMVPRKGEMILTRNLSQLGTRNADAVAVLAGTYTITTDNVRFNMRLLSMVDNEVLAMGSATVPVTDELESILSDKKKVGPPQPSVFTRLP